MVRAFALTIACAAAFALIGALINWAISYIPGNSPGSNTMPGVQVPLAPAQWSQSSPSPRQSSSSPTVQQAPVPYSSGSCLAGNFFKSTPEDVSKVPCSSGQAEYQIIKEFPGASDPSVCESVPDAKFGYLDEYTENGIPVKSYVYCLGEIG